MENERDAETGNLDSYVSLTKTTGQENSLVPVSQALPTRAGRRPKRVAGLLAIAASLIAAGALWLVLGSGLGPPSVPIQTLVAGPVTRVVAVSGRTAAETQVNITAAVSARVEAVPVSEGEQVARGRSACDA